MDIQQFLDAVSSSHRTARSNYHLTLGALRSALTKLPDDAPVVLDIGGGLGREHSYRGYYDDLAFKPSEASTAAQVREACQRAATQEYEGYKGGEYRYSDDTPLWSAPYGRCGLAIVGMLLTDSGLTLITKNTGE